MKEKCYNLVYDRWKKLYLLSIGGKNYTSELNNYLKIVNYFFLKCSLKNKWCIGFFYMGYSFFNTIDFINTFPKKLLKK